MDTALPQKIPFILDRNKFRFNKFKLSVMNERSLNSQLSVIALLKDWFLILF